MTILLEDVVTDICARAGLDAAMFDTTDIAGVELEGFVATNQYTASDALVALSQVFFFDIANYDGVLHFVRRGGDADETITEDEFVDEARDVEQTKKGDAIQIPRVLNLGYYDFDSGGLSPSKQTSERVGDSRVVGEVSIQTAAVITADAAAEAVIVAHRVLAENQRGEIRFSLPDKYLRLTPAQCINVTMNGSTVRVRIVSVSVFDGYQEYVCLRDRLSAYTVANVVGMPPDPSTPPPSRDVGNTLLAVLDIPLLRDADDPAGIGLYVAVGGQVAAWGGAVVDVSRDGGANYTDSATAMISAVIGELTSTLPSHPQEYPDETHVITVRLDTYGATLESATLEQMLGRANLAAIGNEIDGWELINFGDVVEASSGHWQLSTLLRGRKDTAPRYHTPGNKFVLLDRSAIAFQAGSIADIGRTVTVRAVSIGSTSGAETTEDVDPIGATQIERHPGYVVARRDGSNMVVTWQGVGRLGGGSTVAHGARFDGYRVEFEGFGTIVVDTTAQELTQDVSSLSAPTYVRVYQRNSLTGLGPYTEVLVP